MRHLTLAVLACTAAFAGCGRPAPARTAEPSPRASDLPAPRLVRELRTPAAPGSGEPNLAAAPDGGLYLSWIEPAGEKSHRLMLARRSAGGEWDAPRQAAEGRNWFVNWADFPAVAAHEGSLFAHWLVRGAGGGYDYGVRVAVSRDGGATWSAPVTPHRDSTPSEHGFVSLVPRGDGAMGVVWLDGRNAEAGGMRLMASSIDAGAALGPEVVLDDRVCDCCQTAAARTDAGIVVAYRDRSPTEIRDISVVRETPSGWTQPATVGADNWQINGCPVNGPSLAARGRDVALAWFAAPGDESRVQVAFSGDGGATFGRPVRVDDGKPAGRVDVVLLDDGDALVSWLESAGERGEVRVRRVRPDGARGPALVAAGSSTARSTGFPRMERAGTEVVIAWRDSAEPPHVHTAVVRP
jgi:hypothetical protein